jgi:hypothetical protein
MKFRQALLLVSLACDFSLVANADGFSTLTEVDLQFRTNPFSQVSNGAFAFQSGLTSAQVPLTSKTSSGISQSGTGAASVTLDATSGPQLHTSVSAQSTSTVTGVSLQSRAVSSYIDVVTPNDPSAAYISLSAAVDGTVTLPSGFVAAFSNDNYVNFSLFANNVNTDLCGQSGNFNTPGLVNGSMNLSCTALIPIISGSATYQFLLAPIVAAGGGIFPHSVTADFSQTGFISGLQFLDQNMHPLTGLDYSTASGAAYQSSGNTFVPTSVPEPTTLSFTLLGFGILLRRFRTW